MEDSIKTQWAELADTLGQTGVDILAGKPLTVTAKRFREPKVLAIMLMSRTLSNFKGVFTLIENDLVVEARILVRCCFENAFWMAGLEAEGDKFVRKMLQDDVRSRLVRGQMALSGKAELLEDVEKRLREQLRHINKHWPDAKSLNPKKVALSGLLKSGYLLYSPVIRRCSASYILIIATSYRPRRAGRRAAHRRGSGSGRRGSDYDMGLGLQRDVGRVCCRQPNSGRHTSWAETRQDS